MPTFDIAELRRDGFAVTPLPDEVGRIIDAAELPVTIASRLAEDGIDTSGSVRMIGAITTSPTGGPGPYVIQFVQA